jgi:hemerythrin-like domain-containing protein
MSVTTAIQTATRKIGSMISGAPSEPDILDTLKHEHEEVAEMLKRLVESKSGAARKSLVANIENALLPHIQAEQTVLYDALIAVGDKQIKQDGLEGYLEHELAAATLAQLGTISNAMSPEFGATAKVLKELIEHHVQEEENNVWADAKDKFSAEERLSMNQKYLAAKKRVVAPKKNVVAVPKKVVAGARPTSKVAITRTKSGIAAPEKKAAVVKEKGAGAPNKAAGAVKQKVAAKARSRPTAQVVV